MTTVEVLEKALELLGPNGENWYQGEFTSPDGSKFCALGAIRKTTDYGLMASSWNCAHWLFRVTGRIPVWNDAPERTFPEVAAKFREAIELAKAEEK